MAGEDSEGEEDVMTAQDSSGECVLGIGEIATSIHSIKVELSKMNAQKITMTLDRCRTVLRDVSFVVKLRYLHISNIFWCLTLYPDF